jgi:hypothetical protein
MDIYQPNKSQSSGRQYWNSKDYNLYTIYVGLRMTSWGKKHIIEGISQFVHSLQGEISNLRNFTVFLQENQRSKYLCLEYNVNNNLTLALLC